jgi:hypothetical protein
MATVTHRLNPGAIAAVLRGPGVRNDLLRRGHRVKGAASRFVGVDTGRLRASIGVELVQSRGLPAARVGSRVRYARVHHEGHGVIVPRRAKALRFRPKGSRVWVFAKRVRAVKGTKFLTRALPFARG